MTAEDKAFHDTYKPNWGPESTFLYVKPTRASSSHKRLSVSSNNILVNQKQNLVFEKNDLCFAKFTRVNDVSELLSGLNLYSH